MNEQQLAELIAKGIVETGVEGGFDNLCSSTAEDMICLGVSSWEGDRAIEILDKLGLEQFYYVPYSELTDEDKESIISALDSDEGQEIQLEQLAEDCLAYVEAIKEKCPYANDSIVVYVGIWCPTSTRCAVSFMYQYFSNDLYDMANVFADGYAHYADCDEYEEGYYNRAWKTYDYVDTLVMQGAIE